MPILVVGPFLNSTQIGLARNKAIPGVIVDIYVSGDSVNTIAAGASSLGTAITDNSGYVTLDFPDDGLGYWVRGIYPAGSWDTTRPNYVYIEKRKIIDGSSNSNTRIYSVPGQTVIPANLSIMILPAKVNRTSVTLRNIGTGDCYYGNTSNINALNGTPLFAASKDSQVYYTTDEIWIFASTDSRISWTEETR